MIEGLQQGSDQQQSHWRLALWLGLLAAAPFWAGAIALALRAVTLPEKAGNLARVQVWEGTVFALGLAVGLTGAAIALSAISRRARGLGTSLVLLGTASIALSFAMGRSVEDPNAAWPFMLPPLLAFLALMVLLDFLRPVELQSDEVSEEQRQPLSRP